METVAGWAASVPGRFRSADRAEPTWRSEEISHLTTFSTPERGHRVPTRGGCRVSVIVRIIAPQGTLPALPAQSRTTQKAGAGSAERVPPEGRRRRRRGGGARAEPRSGALLAGRRPARPGPRLRVRKLEQARCRGPPRCHFALLPGRRAGGPPDPPRAGGRTSRSGEAGSCRRRRAHGPALRGAQPRPGQHALPAGGRRGSAQGDLSAPRRHLAADPGRGPRLRRRGRAHPRRVGPPRRASGRRPGTGRRAVRPGPRGRPGRRRGAAEGGPGAHRRGSTRRGARRCTPPPPRQTCRWCAFWRRATSARPSRMRRA